MPQLTKDQKKAVEAVHCNVCVSAGAGTGKTSVLVERFLYLISHQLAKSGEVLAITFTEKAAQEMKSRIAERLKNEGLEDARRELENAYLGTIHSFCSRILKEHPIEAGVDPEFRVLQEEEADLLKESALEELIESRFQEPEVFDLLRVYSDPEIRSALKYSVDRVHVFGALVKKFDEESVLISSPLTPTLSQRERNGLTEKMLAALKPLKKLKDRESDCAEIERLLMRPILSWDEFEEAKKIAGLFRRNQAKPEIGIFKDYFNEWIAARAGRLGQNYRNTFIDLASDFEARYSALKTERFSLDFNDLERKALRLLSGDSPRSVACRNLYQKKFKFIMVDEFQDTSPLQDQLISLIATPENLFIVGDWKQSIFGFRGAEASLIVEKEKSFEGIGQTVSLVENFRSRAEVLDEINSFFQTHLFSGLKHFEPLKAASSFPEKKNPSVEFLMISRKDDESMTEARMSEARVLAHRISEMVKAGGYEHRDFAMLFRATTDIYFYEYELRNYGIPYYVVGGRGFYKQPEIRDIISFLELLENPHLDIPLAAVLRSPFVQISDDSLFWLADRSRRLVPPKPFYEALLQFEKIPELNEEDKAKLEQFRSFLFQLLNEKEKGSISECIELIVERTQYDRYVLHLPQGKRHFANIRKLLEVAREVEARGPVHLGDFIRYVKGFETQEVRESEAQVEALEGDVVKLMTIHKAKGLEFKVVLLPDLNRKAPPNRTKFLFDSEYGIGLKVRNEVTQKFEETLSFQKMKERLIQNMKEESKRLLYVAMTRAKDHLIFSGASKAEEDRGGDGFNDGTNWFEWVRQWASSSETVRPELVEAPDRKSGRPFSPLAEHQKIKTALEESQPVKIKIAEGIPQLLEFLKPIEPLYFERIDLPVSAYAVFKHDPEEFKKTYELGVLPEENQSGVSSLSSPLWGEDQGEGKTLTPALSQREREKIRKSGINAQNDTKDEEWPEIEDEEGKTLNAADFGTVIHKIFEHLVTAPEQAQAKLKFWLTRFQKNLDETTFKEVKNLSELFLKSEQFSEIKSAKKRYPEVPFVLRLHHGIIQGTLDLLYQNPAGAWVILDYKTSQIKEDDLKTYADRYQGQMLLYALACHELLNLNPKLASLYFARVDRSFEFSLAGVDYGALRREFESLQKQILSRRKAWMTHQ